MCRTRTASLGRLYNQFRYQLGPAVVRRLDYRYAETSGNDSPRIPPTSICWWVSSIVSAPNTIISPVWVPSSVKWTAPVPRSTNPYAELMFEPASERAVHDPLIPRYGIEDYDTVVAADFPTPAHRVRLPPDPSHRSFELGICVSQMLSVFGGIDHHSDFDEGRSDCRTPRSSTTLARDEDIFNAYIGVSVKFTRTARRNGFLQLHRFQLRLPGRTTTGTGQRRCPRRVLICRAPEYQCLSCKLYQFPIDSSSRNGLPLREFSFERARDNKTSSKLATNEFQPSNQSEAHLHAIDYWQVIKNRYGVILLTFLLVFMTALVITYVMPKKLRKQGSRRRSSRRAWAASNPGFSDGTASRSTCGPNFFATEFEVIRAQKTLDNAVENLDLVNRWNTDPESVRRTLKQYRRCPEHPRHVLIEIRVRYSDPKDAQGDCQGGFGGLPGTPHPKIQMTDANQALTS